MTQDPPSSSRLSHPSSNADSQSRTHGDNTGIDPATFYGSSASGLGSTTTSYIPPESTSFRHPVLVEEELIPKDPQSWAPDTISAWGEPSDGWDNLNSLGDAWGEPDVSRKIPIDGRDDYEEVHWYDPAVRALHSRPGAGVLPPLLADLLHDPDHALYSVSTQVRPPLISPPSPYTPTPDEVRTAIPHPNAYFCREHNGWVLLLWKASTVLPPLVKEPEPPIPDQSRRKRTNSCVGDGEQPFGQANLTHHWHRYEKAVDATKLNPPYAHGELVLDLYLCCQCSMYCLVSDVIPGVVPLALVNNFTLDKIGHPAIDKTPKATAVAGWETVLTIIDNRLWRDEKRSLPVARTRFRTKIGWNEHVERVFAALGFPLDKLSQSEEDGKAEELALQPPPIDPSTAEGKASRTKLLRAWVELSAWLAIYEKANKEAFKDYNTMVVHVKADSERDLYQTGIGAHVSQIARGILPEHIVSETQLEPSWIALGMTPSTYSWEHLTFAYLAQCRCDPANTMVYFTHLVTIVNALLNLRAGGLDQLQAFIVQEKERYRFTIDEHARYGRMLGFGRDNDLGVELDSEVDDEFIARAWRSARQRAWMNGGDASQKRAQLNDALKVVAEQRGSAALMKVWIEEKGSGMSPETAYQTLDVPREVDETMLLTVYSMRIEDQPSQSERMREALSVIAEVTNSERLRQFLATGRDPGDTTILNTSPEMPRGLNQLGNTCYLNSLLQYFYTIKDLRVAIGSLTTADSKFLDDSKFTDDDLKRHRVGGRLVTRREILRSKKFVNLLSELFWNMEFCETASVTPAIELAKLALVTSQDEEEDETDKAGTDSSNDTDATLVDDMAPRPSFDRPSPPAPAQSPTGSVLGKRARDRDVDGDGELPMDIDSTPAHSPSGPSAPSPPSSKASGSSGSGGSSEDAAGFIDDAVDGPSTSKLPVAGNGDGEADPDVEMKDGSSQSQAAGKVPPPLPPRKRQAADSVMMFGRQHDVSECMDNCMFQIETALLDFQGIAVSEDDKTSPIKRLFYGKKRQRLVSLSPNDDARHQSSIHEKEDLFSQVHVNVAEEGFDLYDGLARYFDDVVEIGGQKKQMEVSIVDPPPLLQVQLQRVQFNRETQQAYKSQAYVKFGETIYMDRFLDSADPGKKARSKAIQMELTTSRERVHHLTQGKHAPFAPAFGNTVEYLTKQTAIDLGLDDDFAVSLSREESLITEQLRVERERTTALKAQMEEIWKDETAAAYELTSVFIHRGSSPSWGHYFFYSRNLPDRPDEWFKYNDSDVSAVSKEEVLADTTSSTANPYMLVFVRKGYDAIDTVHRFNPDTLQDDE